MKYLFITICLIFPNALKSQATAVVDAEHQKTSAIEAATETAATGLKQFFEKPWIEKISKVQSFFKDASQLVSKVVQNLRMTRQLIQTEKDIYELFVRSVERIDNMEDFTDKWKHRWILLQLLNESTKVFEIFDLATQQNMGIIDDKGRIKLIKKALTQANTIKRSMRAAVRRTNRTLYKLKRKQKDIETFSKLFKHN